MKLDDPRRLALFHRGRVTASDDPVLAAIVAAVAREADAPIALVSLVMDRVQIFRAAVGLPAELALARATNRCDSFCQFVVEEEDLFLVEDAPNDPRVPRALVERYGIIAYAGAPVRVAGHVLGSLCVIDVRPRTFSEAFLAALRQSAAQASERLRELGEVVEPEAPLVGAQIDPRGTVRVLLRALTKMAAAAKVGSPLMRSLAALPREAWTVDQLGLSAVDLAEAAVFYRSLAGELDRVQVALDLLHRAMGPGASPAVRAVAEEVRRLGREVAEGLAFVRVIEALTNAGISAGEATRALSVLHVAFGFHDDLLATLDRAVGAVKRLESSAAQMGGQA